MQGIDRASRPTLRELYRTAWELPQRALIDMAAERGAVHRPEPVAQPVHGDADHRQALARCTATPGSRASRRRTTCARARRRASPAGHRRRSRTGRRRPRPTPAGASPARSRTPSPARPASDAVDDPDREAATRSTTRCCSTRACDLTLRPMRYPDFYEHVPRRDQEHLDGRGGRLLRPTSPTCAQADRRPSGTWSAAWSRSSPPATRSSPTTWCSTSTSTSTRPRRGCTCRASCSRRRVHVQFYLTLLDTYLPDHGRARSRRSPRSRTSRRSARKAEFCFRWIDSIERAATSSSTADDRRQFLLNLICFAACIEGLFFFGAFAYVYFLRSRGLLHGLAAGTNWVFRDETHAHGLRLRGRRHRARARSRSCSTTSSSEQVARDARRGRRVRAAVRRGPAAATGVPGMIAGRHARVPASTSPTSGSRSSACRRSYGSKNPFALHGAAGRAGAVELLRAPRLGLPGRRRRRRRLRRRLLSVTPGVLRQGSDPRRNRTAIAAPTARFVLAVTPGV